MEVAVIPCLYDNYTYLVINGNEAAVVDFRRPFDSSKRAGEVHGFR